MTDLDKWFRSTSVPNTYFAVGAAQPFYLAYHEMNNVALSKQFGNLCISWMTTLNAPTPSPQRSGRRTGKFRIGIASGHIRDHSVWIAVSKGWTTRIDRKKFEIYLFSLNSQVDKETEKAKQDADFFDGQVKGVLDWIDSIQRSNLDALIYPAIGMDALTYQLASLRLAPLQANSWGHPETSGLSTIDYYFSGDAFEPPDADNNYSEKLVRLPNFGAHVEPLEPKMKDPDLDALNLPKGVPLLLCPGTPFKYTPYSDWVWVEIAKGLAARGGRLVFFASSRGSMYISLIARFRRAFKAAAMVFESHVCVCPVLDRQRFYGLMQKSTLLLDTLGFSGFNTALQSLECGLPVLAYEGKFMRGRLASGIMRNMGMHDLVATSPEDFINKAVDLALDERKLKKLRSEIPKRRKALFRDDSPIRAFEDFLEREISKQRAG
jgi:predicted O-linked N-acetylglucosamine transferase (SPINDLY family)